MKEQEYHIYSVKQVKEKVKGNQGKGHFLAKDTECIHGRKMMNKMCNMPWTCFINKFLTTSDLNKIAKNNEITKPYYLGTFAANLFPENITENCCWIWNTDELSKDGQHWLGFWKHGNKVLYFDSYGKDLKLYKRLFWKTFIEDQLKCRFIHINCRQIQSMGSTTCGSWCLLFIHEQSKIVSTNSNKITYIPITVMTFTHKRNKNPIYGKASLLLNKKKLRDL